MQSNGNNYRKLQNEYYGINQLAQPVVVLFVLGQAIAENGPNRQTIFGDFLELTPNHTNKNRARLAGWRVCIIAAVQTIIKTGTSSRLKRSRRRRNNDCG